MMEKILEFQNKAYGQFIVPKSKLLEKQSKFQKIELFENGFYGRILRLDGYFQTSEFDEFLYHESLIQFPLFSHPSPKIILIIGGGDGGAIEEAVKHKYLVEIYLVELDKDVIEIAKKYLGKIHNNSFNDLRVKILIQDGSKFLKETEKKFDVIILDLTDPSGESKNLYTKEFYELVSSKLNSGGILSLHTETYLNSPELFSRIFNTLKSVFKHVKIHSNFIPLYGTILAFALCSKDLDFDKLSNRTISKKFRELNLPDLKYFSPPIFKSAFVLPKYALDNFNLDKRISTIKSPIEDMGEIK